jgi:hypothetical protein
MFDVRGVLEAAAFAYESSRGNKSLTSEKDINHWPWKG